MIKFDRGSEPDLLLPIRIAELQRVGKIVSSRPPTNDDIGKKYKLVLKYLWDQQLAKCCFCDCYQHPEYNDVEHYRPKTAVKHSEEGEVKPGYWWLAWTWENLMFCCSTCNRSFKRTSFPLDEASVPLKPMEQPPGQEIALLINPYEENPIEHIQFKRIQVGDYDRWCPFPRNQSRKGERTIKVVGLRRPSLFEAYERHFQNQVELPLKEIHAAIRQGDRESIARTWKKETRPLLNRRMPLAGLSYDILDDAFPESIRAEFDLELNRNF